jgi:hypothetical protein
MLCLRLLGVSVRMRVFENECVCLKSDAMPTSAGQHGLDRLGCLFSFALLDHSDDHVDSDDTNDKASLNPVLESSNHNRSGQQDEDEHIIQLRPELGEKARFLGRSERVGAVPAWRHRTRVCRGSGLAAQLLQQGYFNDCARWQVICACRSLEGCAQHHS